MLGKRLKEITIIYQSLRFSTMLLNIWSNGPLTSYVLLLRLSVQQRYEKQHTIEENPPSCTAKKSYPH